MVKIPATIVNDFRKYGRLLFEQGLNNLHSGNMSARTGDIIYVTRHGARLGDLSGKDIVAVNLGNEKKDGPASFEVKVHRAVYKACPGVKAIVHGHPPYAIVLSLKNKVIRPVDSEGAYYLPSVPVLACRETIASSEVACKLPELISGFSAAVVRGHGAFCGGKDIDEAALRLSVLESASRVIYLSSAHDLRI